MTTRSKRALALAACGAVALSGLLVLPTAAQAAEIPDGALAINEIETDGSPDWAELVNTSDAAIDISGVLLRGRENGFEFTVPAGTSLAPGAFFTAHSAAEELGDVDPDATVEITESSEDAFKFKKSDQFTVLAADGATVLDSYEWGDFHLSTWGRVPDGTGDLVELGVKTPGAANAEAEAPGEIEPDENDLLAGQISITEVTSANLDPFRDAYELHNSGDVDVDIARYLQADSGSAPAALDAPNGTVVPAGGYVVFLSNQGLSSDGDAVRLFTSTGDPIDAVSWLLNDAEPGSWSLCGDEWKHTEYDSWGGANEETCSKRIIDPHDPSGDVQCQTEPPSDLGDEVAGGMAWPGSQEWRVVDSQCQFVSEISGQDVSGLDIDPSDADVLWAVKNKSVVYRLIKDGDLWVNDTANDWSEGKTLVFPSGAGQPDTEGITLGPDGFLYMTTERDNTSKRVALDSVLRFDPNETGTLLHPTTQWVVTEDFAEIIDPADADDANLGFEGITWVPDSVLTEHGFIDESTGEAYDPADYAGHGTGLFFLALEKNGALYPYALAEDGSYATRIAEISTGMARIADVQWDFDNDRIWAVGDDSVGGSATLLQLDETGAFTVERVFNRPTGLENLNLEGFAIAPDTACVDGVKEVIRSDDGNNGGHSLWSGTVSCDLGLEPVVDEPVVDEPVVNEPVVDEPVVDEPVVNEPAVEEPAVRAPAPALPEAVIWAGGGQLAATGGSALPWFVIGLPLLALVAGGTLVARRRARI